MEPRQVCVTTTAAVVSSGPLRSTGGLQLLLLPRNGSAGCNASQSPAPSHPEEEMDVIKFIRSDMNAQ